MPIRFVRPLVEYLKSSKIPITITVLAILGSILLSFVSLGDRPERVLRHAFEVLLIIGVWGLFLTGTRFGRNRMYHHYDISKANNLRQRRVRTQIDFIYRLVNVVIVFTGAAIILMTFEEARKLGTSLIASAGVASVLIGFAAQRSLSNMIAGFQIAFTQPMRIDDVVIVEREWGRVEEITLTYVVVKLWDLRRLVLPLSYFIEKPFENWTRTSADILGSFFFYVDYSASVSEIRDHLMRVTKSCPLWDGKVCLLQVTDFTESSMQLRVLVSAANASDAFDLRCYIREQLVTGLQDRKVISYPRRRLELENIESKESWGGLKNKALSWLLALTLGLGFSAPVKASEFSFDCQDQLGQLIQTEFEKATVFHRAIFSRYLFRAERKIRLQIERACRNNVCTPEVQHQAVRDAVEDFVSELKVGLRRLCATGVWALGVGGVCGATVLVGEFTDNKYVTGGVGTVIGMSIVPLLSRLVGPFDQVLGGRLLAWAAGKALSVFSPYPAYHKIWEHQVRIEGTTLKGTEIINEVNKRVVPLFQAASLEYRAGNQDVAAKLVAEAALSIGEEFRYLLNRSDEVPMQSVARKARVFLAEPFDFDENFKRHVMNHIMAADLVAAKNGLVAIRYRSLITDWLDKQGVDPIALSRTVTEIDASITGQRPVGLPASEPLPVESYTPEESLPSMESDAHGPKPHAEGGAPIHIFAIGSPPPRMN